MAKLLDRVLPSQLSPIQLVCSQAFCIGSALILYISIANALFIELYGVKYLPFVFVAAAVVIPTLAFGFNKLATVLSIGRLIQSILITIIGLFVASWILNLLFVWPWVSFCMMVSFFFITSYLLTIQGMQASQFFDVRELKSKSAAILTSSMAGAILFGLTSRFWSDLFGNHIHLILLAAIILTVMYVLADYTIDQHPQQFQKKRETKSETSENPANISSLLRQPFIRSIFIYQFLSTVATQLILYVFLTQANYFFQQSPDNLTPFFANFLAIGQAIAVGSLILFVRPMLKRIGISFGLMTNPLAVFTLVIALLIATPIFPNQISIIFWLATITMAADIVFSFSTTNATVRTLYQIIPHVERDKLKNTIEAIGIPLAFAFAGLSLVPFSFFPELNKIYILVYILFVCILWLISSWHTIKLYGQTLHERLNRRMLDEVDLSLDNAETFSRVEGLIGTGNPALIRLALNLLKHDNHSTYHSRLKGLLNYRNEKVLTNVLDRIEEERVPELYVTMTRLFDRHKSARIKGQLLKTISACYPVESSEFVQAYMDDPDQNIQKGSLVGLIKYGVAPGGTYAGARLIDVQKDSNIESQLYMASILEDVGLSSFYQPLLDQFDHINPSVRNGALKAATKVVHPQLLDGIIESLKTQSCRSCAMDALLAHGRHLIPIAPDILSIKNHNTPRQVKARIVRVLGQLKTDNALNILYSNIGHPDIVVRSAILNALRNSRYRAETEEEKEVIDEQILAELLDAGYLVAIERDIGTGKEMATLHTALKIELVNIRSRLFNLLSFIYDRNTIWTAHSHMSAEGKKERTVALETLDILLSDKHQQQISAVIDRNATAESRINALKHWIIIPEPQAAHLQLRSLINSDQTRSWTQACAIYSAVQSQFTQLLTEIDVVTSSDNPIVRETAQWAVKKLVKETNSEEYDMITIEKVAILKATNIFSDTPENVLASVASIVREIPLEANETFIHQGDSADEMYLVVEGQVEALINNTPIITLGQGQTVGELAIFNQEPRSADVRTLTPALLFSIEREALNEIMADRPEIAQGIIGALSRRIREQGQLMSQSA